MDCPRCRHANPPGQKFCGECGARLAMVGAAGSVPGSEIDLIPSRLAEAAASPKAAREGERKQVSVLFCDIANSTRLADELGADRMHGVVNEFFENALTQIRRFEGTINVFLGDGFMALFGEPFAYEDHARRAALAGLAIQDMLKERTSAFLPADKSLSVRIGINSGAVVVGKVGDNLRWDYTAIGDTTNVAARLQAEAEPGTIACSEAVARAIVNNVDCRPLGMRALKGKPEPVPVYQVVRARSGTARSPDAATPIVGRHEILTDIRAAVDRAASGKGGILGVVGEAGIGKSRLLAEARSFASERGLRWIEGSGLSFGGMLSYWPFRELVRACFEIAEDDDEHLCWSRLRVRMVDRLGQERPMVVAFEDWHWADASSADLLEHLLSLAATTPILYLVASRPAQDGAWEKLRTAIVSDARLSPHYREFALAPLADDDVTRLIAHLLGGGTLPVAIRAVLLRRASGNPFFLGELIRALQASRVLEKDPATGAWIATGPFDPSLLPDSVEGVILARIDRLEDEAKQVLKVAAVVGRSFFYRVLSSITEGATSLDANLAKLVRSEFIDCRRQLPELEYMFKHPLIQQASYRSLLAERRRLLHKRAGETIEQLFQARLEEFYSLLAYHFAQAEHWAKAHEYLLKAADHAGGMAADAEALELYQQALDASERSTQAQVTALTRAELDFKIGEALYRSGKQEQAVGFLRQALRRLGIDFPLARSDIKSATVRELIRCLPALLMHGPNAKAPPD
ncbi:MAG: AAA family ATPase, partial [Burkholderiales bacterium]|nr:AAA family ATPase [Burkholderiales bacterium]